MSCIELFACLLAGRAAKRYDEFLSAIALMKLIVLKPTAGEGMAENPFTRAMNPAQCQMVAIGVAGKIYSRHSLLPARAERQFGIFTREQNAVIQQAIFAVRGTAGRANGTDNSGADKRGLLFHEIVSFILYSLVGRAVYRKARARIIPRVACGNDSPAAKRPEGVPGGTGVGGREIARKNSVEEMAVAVD